MTERKTTPSSVSQRTARRTDRARAQVGNLLALLQRGISERQHELQYTADTLAKRAERYGRIATLSKIMLVVLGALSASKAAADQLIGSASSGSIVFYALVGVLTAMIAGLEAALRFDRRSTELTILAAECQACIRKVDSEWYKRIGAAREGDKVKGATALLDLQDEKLGQVQEKASKAGLNITFTVRSLDRLGEDAHEQEVDEEEQEIGEEGAQQSKAAPRRRRPRRRPYPA